MEDKLQVLKLVRKYIRTNKTRAYNEMVKSPGNSRNTPEYRFNAGRMDMGVQLEAYVEQLIKELEEAKNDAAGQDVA